VLVALVFVTLFSNRGGAEDFKRIRPLSALLTTVIATTHERSLTFRSIIERIEQSDVIVHLTCAQFKSVTLAGRTWLVTTGPDVRYVQVQVLCQQTEPALVGIVAHELEHVAEIASTAWVVDAKSFARLFSKIGFSTCLSLGLEQFETAAAIATGERVRSEYLHQADTSVEANRRFAGSVDRRSGPDRPRDPARGPTLRGD
jgi:hypothetical protein